MSCLPFQDSDLEIIYQGPGASLEKKSLVHLEFWLLKTLINLGVSTRTLSFPSPAGGQGPGWKGKQVELARTVQTRAGMVNSLELEARREEGRHGPCGSH